MKEANTRNTVLGLVALLALTIYILACTSFSPDDSKVLYPAFDKVSGRIGIAVYDRETRRSDLLLVPLDMQECLVRAAWMPDGRQALVFWSGGDNSGPLRLALMPVAAAQGPARFLEIPDIKDHSSPFAYGIGYRNRQVYLVADSNRVDRLSLDTGDVESREIPGVKGDFCILPAPGANGLFYLSRSNDEPGSALVFGRMDAQTFALKPVITVTNELRDQSFIAYNAEGTALAFVEAVDDADRLIVARQGNPTFARPLHTSKQTVSFGNAGFFGKGDALWATFARKDKEGKTAAYGFMQIPLSQAPIRETVLITNGPVGDVMGLYFQGAVSHDGKTAAVASTYLAKEKLNPADCALFFIDLGDPTRKITRVPIPVPDEAGKAVKNAP